MSSVECLRNFVSERLTAAAEEIFGVFIKTIVEYEEEIDRQRRLLDVVLKPEIKLHRIELPQQHVFTEEEEVLSDQQLCDQERNSSLDQEDPADLSQIKEEHEELCTSQEGEQFVLKPETDTFTLTPTYMENDHSESESKSDRRFLSDNWHVVQSQDQKWGVYGDSTPTSTEPEPKKAHPKSRSQSIAVSKSNLSETGHAMHTGKKKQYSCEACEKAFTFKSQLYVHMKTHTGEKPYPCSTCGKRFARTEALSKHVRTHTGEKPFSCNTCGKRFSQSENLSSHVRTHTGEKPFMCKTCGKAFTRRAKVTIHMRRAHTGEKPYLCKICGKRYFEKFVLTRHMKIKH